jgi:hypothetical protein
VINPLPIAIFGIGVYFMMWWNHENRGVPNPRGTGTWRSAPRFLRRVLRRGEGPILVGAVAIEAMAAVMLVAAVLGSTRTISPQTTAQLAVGSTGIPLVTWTYLWLRGLIG